MGMWTWSETTNSTSSRPKVFLRSSFLCISWSHFHSISAVGSLRLSWLDSFCWLGTKAARNSGILLIRLTLGSCRRQQQSLFSTVVMLSYQSLSTTLPQKICNDSVTVVLLFIGIINFSKIYSMINKTRIVLKGLNLITFKRSKTFKCLKTLSQNKWWSYLEALSLSKQIKCWLRLSNPLF